MEESKKRVRPTWAQVRKLEADIAELKLTANTDGCYDRKLEEERDYWKKKFDEQLEGTSGLIADCNGWRDKFRECKEEYAALKKKYDDVVADNAFEELEKTKKTIQEANKQLTTLQKQLKDSDADYCRSRREVHWLLNRSLWQRIINKRMDL